MRKARHQDRRKIVNLLAAAFRNNRSVNWIIKKDPLNKEQRIKDLMSFALEESFRADGAYISEDEKAVFLFTRPRRKPGGLAGLISSAKFALSVIGLFGLPKVLRREKYVKNKHPKEDFIYLWFIGTEPGFQGKGLGSKILSELLALADRENLSVYLETSTPENLHFYKKHHFTVYHEWQDPEAGFPLWFLRREVVPNPA